MKRTLQIIRRLPIELHAIPVKGRPLSELATKINCQEIDREILTYFPSVQTNSVRTPQMGVWWHRQDSIGVDEIESTIKLMTVMVGKIKLKPRAATTEELMSYMIKLGGKITTYGCIFAFGDNKEKIADFDNRHSHMKRLKIGRRSHNSWSSIAGILLVFEPAA